MFDVIGLGEPSLAGRTWSSGEDWAVLVETTENQADRTLIRDIETFRRIAELYRRRHEVHRVRLFDIRRLCDQLASYGFATETARSYDAQQRRSVVLADVENRNNVGMIQGGSGLGFLLKAAKTVGIARPVLGKHFDRHVAFQCGIAGAIDFAHAARAQGRDDLIGIDPGPCREWHLWGGLYP